MSDAPPTPGIPEIRKADDYQELYVNNIRFAMTPNDLVIMFGRIMEVEVDKTQIEEKIALRFSPQTYKRLAAGIVASMAAYESQFGQVVLPPGKAPDEIMAGIEAVLASFTRTAGMRPRTGSRSKKS